MKTALARPLPIDFPGFMGTTLHAGNGTSKNGKSVSSGCCEVKCLIHELRNYACTMKGNAILLRQHVKEAAATEPLERMDRTIVKMERLLEEILEAFKEQAPKEWKPLELKAFLLECMSEHFPERAKALEVRSKDSCMVDGDPRMLERVFMNLIRNAFEAGGEKIQVAIQSSEDGIHLRFADNGRGCAEPDRERLFQPFVSMGRKTEGKGTGLGLHIVRTIMKCHGGAIHAESIEETQGRGMVFHLRFPKIHRRSSEPRGG